MSEVPRKVRRLLEACLQKNPRNRLHAIGDWRLLLVEREPQRTSWVWPTVACIVVLAAAGLPRCHFRETQPLVQSLRYQLTRVGDSEFAQFQLSPDGRKLAFVDRSNASFRLYVRTYGFSRRPRVSRHGWNHVSFLVAGQHAHRIFLSGQVEAGGCRRRTCHYYRRRAGCARRRRGVRTARLFLRPPWSARSFVWPSPAMDLAAAATPLDLPRVGAGARDSLRFPAFLSRIPTASSIRLRLTNVKARASMSGSLNGDAAASHPAGLLHDPLRCVPLSPETNGFILFRRGTTLMAQPFDAANLTTDRRSLSFGRSCSGFREYVQHRLHVSTNGTLIFMSDARRITRAGTHLGGPQRETVASRF